MPKYRCGDTLENYAILRKSNIVSRYKKLLQNECSRFINKNLVPKASELASELTKNRGE